MSKQEKEQLSNVDLDTIKANIKSFNLKANNKKSLVKENHFSLYMDFYFKNFNGNLLFKK